MEHITKAEIFFLGRGVMGVPSGMVAGMLQRCSSARGYSSQWTARAAAGWLPWAGRRRRRPPPLGVHEMPMPLCCAPIRACYSIVLRAMRVNDPLENLGVEFQHFVICHSSQLTFAVNSADCRITGSLL
jgi:hypothetical protein